MSPIALAELKCEYSVNPLGIDVLQPRFSWILQSSRRGQCQTAYQILIAGSEEKLKRDIGDKWDSKMVQSDNSANIEYQGEILTSGEICYWKVRVWDLDNKVSAYSTPATFEMGLLRQDDWEGTWIKGGNLFRNEFGLGREIEKARAYICGLGYYELRINGEKVGDHVLDPGYTDYAKQLLYVSYDITDYVKSGNNAVGVMLGNGWFSPQNVTLKQSPITRVRYGDSPALLLQMRIDFTDGTSGRIVSDKATWKTAAGPITSDSIYDGETYDARLEKPGWDTAPYDDSGWDAAEVADSPGGVFVSQASFPPIKIAAELPPISMANPEQGVYVFDFGQNFSGWIRLKVLGSKGTRIKLRHAELIHENGMINIYPNQGAKATDEYILKGDLEEVYEPRFSYHGFRYVQVTGYPGAPTLESLEGCVVHSAVKPSGEFTCSNQLINKIHQNVLWGQQSNLMSVPTDCPQRDERMGWMADAQLTAEEAIFNFDMTGFYTKWCSDIKKAQRENGGLPNVAPPNLKLTPEAVGWDADPAWGTACVTIPWYLYLYYGDTKILREHFEVMKNWVNYLASQAKDHVLFVDKFADWCAPSLNRKTGKTKETPGEITSTCYFYHDALIVSKIAGILGRSEDGERYSKLAGNIKIAFSKRYIENTDMSVPSLDSQASNILPLAFDMVPDPNRQELLKYLVDDIVLKYNSHLNTGIVGTRYLFEVLTRYGHAELAYTLAAQTTFPGWGYMIQQGATTLWERWEHIVVEDSNVNSQNHPSFGSIDAFFYKVIAGINIDPSFPGFARIVIKPYPVGNIEHASASLNTIRGLVSSSWSRKSESFQLEVCIPCNTSAMVCIPKMDFERAHITESGNTIWQNQTFTRQVAGIADTEESEKTINFEVESGTYSFKLKSLGPTENL